jgi:hypothetical protein
MSFYFTLFIGPYAEWRVRLGEKGDPPVDEEPWYTPLIEGQILALAEADGLPEVKVGRARFAQYRFMPRQERPGHPPRKMYFPLGMADSGGDWSWLNPRAEIDWFSETFSEELATLTSHLGGPPTMGWGVLMSY